MNYLEKLFTSDHHEIPKYWCLWISKSKLRERCAGWLLKIIFHFLPLVNVCVANKKINKSRKKIEDNAASIAEFNKKKDLNNDDVYKLYERLLEWKRIIDAKAKNNLFAITISMSLLSILIGSFLKGETFQFVNTHQYVRSLLFIFFVGLVYFLYAGYSALCALRVKEIGFIGWSDLIQKKENESSYKRELIKSIEITQLTISESTNYLDACYIGLRNGMIFCTLSIGAFLIFKI